MNFPLLKTFEVSNIVTSFLNKKFDQYKSEFESFHSYGDSFDKNGFDQKKGYQTDNLVFWKDKDFKKFAEEDLLELVSSQLDIEKSKVSYHYIHFLDYESGGSMRQHRHWHNEDFVMFIYCKDCKNGKTIFYLNDYCDEFKERTQVGVMPKKDLAAIFSSQLLHKGELTTDKKRIFVVGIRVNLIGQKAGFSKYTHLQYS